MGNDGDTIDTGDTTGGEMRILVLSTIGEILEILLKILLEGNIISSRIISTIGEILGSLLGSRGIGGNGRKRGVAEDRWDGSLFYHT